MATFTQDMVDWAVLNPDKTVGEFLAERPEAALKTAIATTMATLIQTTVAVGADKAAGFLDKSRQQEKREADLSTAGREAMKNLVAAAAESKARERDPDQFKDYVDKLAQDGPVKSAYFSPEACARAAQTMGKTPDELATMFGVEDQVQASLASGTKIEVPLGVFLEKVGGLASADAILKDVTTSPFLLSEVEEAAIPEAARQRLLADADRVAQAAQGDAAFAAGVETVRASVEKNLTEVGRFVGMPNTLYSQLAATFYGNLAQQLGSTPEAMLQRFPLRVVGERITGGTTAAPDAYDQPDDEFELTHFSKSAELTETDPSFYSARNRMLPPEERQNMGVAPDRTYFGIDEGQPGGYRKEQGLGGNVYYARYSKSKLYDMAADPLNLKEKTADIVKANREKGRMITSGGALEIAIKDAGFKGYWIDNTRLGKVAAIFENVPVSKERVPAKPKAPPQDYPAVVNIGLKIGEDGVLDPMDAKAAVEATGAKITEEATHTSDTESTLVLVLDRPLTKEELFTVSEATQQDAVAQRTGIAQGMLAGPKAEAWGDYTSEYFLMPDGTRANAYDEKIAPKFNQGEAFDKEGNQIRGRIGGTAEARSAGFAILDTNPNLPLEQLRDQLGISPRQASDIRKAWKESRGVPNNQKRKPGHPGPAYKQDQFTPLNELAVDDLSSIPEPLWNDHIKATKYAAYRLPTGIEEAFLPKGYVVVQSSAGNYAVREQHLKERMGTGEKFARMEQGGRGYYTPSTATIQLMAKADLSTFLHEIGHHFLELRFNVAKQLKEQQAAGETLTTGEQELLDDVREWFRQAGIKPGNPGEGNALPQDVSWGLYFFDNILIDPTEAELKEFQKTQALAGKGPVVKLFKTTNGRVVAFPGNEYSHADARMLLEHNNKPSAQFKMRHATWDGRSLKFQNWYDVTGVLDDDGGKFAQEVINSLKEVGKLTPAERAEWYAAEVEEESTPRFNGRAKIKLSLLSDPALQYPDINIDIVPQVNRDGRAGVAVDLYFNGNVDRDRGTKATPEDLAKAQQVFARGIAALQAYAEKHRPDYIAFTPTSSRTESRSKLYDALLRRYPFGYEARITSEIDIVATETKTTKGRARRFLLVRPDIASEVPLELSNAEIKDGEWFGEPSVEKRRVITEIVQSGRSVPQPETGDTGGPGSSATDAGQSYAQGRPRQAVEVSDETIDRASKELNEKQFEAWKQAVAGVSNEDIAVSMGGEDGDVTPAQVANWIFEAKGHGYPAPQQPRGLTISSQTMHVIAMSARGNSLSEIADAVYPDRSKDKAINLVKQIRFQRKNLIEQWKAHRAALTKRGLDVPVAESDQRVAGQDAGQGEGGRQSQEEKLGQGPIFYSALKRAAEGAKQAKASAADWKAILKKAEGVKAEEIEAVGLFDYLDMLAERGEKQITREDVVAFLDANGVRVVDVLLGPPAQRAAPAPDPVSAEDRADYDGIVAENEEEIARLTQAQLRNEFEEQKEVFIESDPAAQRLYDRELASQSRIARRAAYDAYFDSGDFEPKFYVSEEPQDDYTGPGPAPTVWVVRSRESLIRRVQSQMSSVYNTNAEATEDVENRNKEDLHRAARTHAGATEYELDDEVLAKTWDAVSDRIFAMYAEDTGARDKARKASIAEIFDRIGESELYNTVNQVDEARMRGLAGWTEAEGRPNYPDTRWEQYTLVKGKQYRELLLTLDSHKGQDFTYDNHWRGLKNFIAHIRFSIVGDTVVIDEMQSDWHQRGRDKGYVDQRAINIAKAAKQAALDAYDDALRAASRELAATPEAGEALYDDYSASYKTMRVIHDMWTATFGSTDNVLGANPGKVARFAEIGPELDRLRGEVNTANAEYATLGSPDAAPDAPFKDDAWAKLALKRMIRWAAENGYEEIAWTPGDVHAERWNMHQVVDKLNIIPVGQDKWALTGYKGGRTVFSKQDLTRGGIAEYVGKATADQLFAQPVEPKDAKGFENTQTLDIAEDDFMAGPGKGMRFFYDTRLVNEANKLGKKYGAKVGEKVFDHPGTTRPAGHGGVATPTSSLYHVLPITEELAAAALEGAPLFQPEQDGPPSGNPLSAEEKAFFARAMRELPPGSDEIDMWDAMSFREREPYHELWARQVEAYFFEGKAPTPKLKRMFDKFREWLLNVYPSIVNLNAPLSDEVRSIMDRMLASKQEIADTERNHALQPMFATKPDAMSDQEWADYQGINQQATADAEKTLSQRSLRDVKWLSNARSKEMRRLQNEAREQRKAMGAEVAAEVMAEPVNVARRFFSKGQNKDGTKVDDYIAVFDKDGQLVSGKPKLSIPALMEMYPEGSDTDWRALGYGQYGMLAKEGLHPDALAGMFGYESGDAMVRDLLTAEPMADKINGITDQRMLERYGDLTDEASIARAADEAVYSSLRGKVLAAEYAALSAALGERKLLNEAAKTAAETLVRRLNASKLNANKFLAAERSAGRAAEAALRKNDIAGAAAAKKDQLLSFYIAKEVMTKQKEYDKAKLKFKQIIDAKRDTVSKSRNFDLVQASRAILAAYGMATMKHKPMDYMGAVKRYDPTLYSNLEPTLLNALTSGQKLSDLTVEQFFGLRDVVVQLWDLSREEKLVEINGQKMALKDVTDELNLHMEALGADPNKPITQAPTPAQRTLRLLEGAAASLRRVEAWARLMDKGTVGPFTKFVWRPISQAATRYRLDQTKYILKFRELFAPIEANLSNARIAATELGYTFANKAELLHAILHTGNASNKRKLLMGYRWAQERADGSMDTTRWDAFLARMAHEGVLTVQDYNFAQSVWDLLEETKPLAQEAHRRVFGRYFAEITADVVHTPFGDFKGGYVPAIYDDHHNTDVALKRGQDAIEGNDSSMFPAPTKGFTEARVEYNRPMQLDVRLLAGHLDKVLKFAHMASPVRDVLRILRSPGVERHLHDLHPTAVEDMLLPWLVRSARQTNEAPIGGKAGRAVTNFANGLRRRSNMGLMFGNLVNVLQQPTGLFNAFTYKGVKKRYIGQAMARFLRDPAGIHGAVRALSPLIETRATQQAIAMRDTLDTIVAPTGKFEQAAAWFERHTYFMQTALQNQQDVVVWLGAYESAKSRGDNEADAAQFADGVIRQTQGSSTPEDISRFETGTGWQKILVSMYGYFNMWGNQLSTEFRLAAQDQGLKKNKGRLLYVYVAGFMAPALLAQLIADAIRGDLPAPDDEDEGLSEWLAWFFGTQAKTAAAMVPIVGASVIAGVNAFNDKPYDDRVLSSPAVSAVETLVRVPKNFVDYLGGEGDLSRTTKDSLSLLTLMTGLPFQALGRPLGYLADVAEGDTEPKDAVDVARGMIAGR